MFSACKLTPSTYAWTCYSFTAFFYIL